MRNVSVVVCGMVLAAGAVSAQTMIYNVDDLQDMLNNLGGDYVLANDIDASDTVNWDGGAGFVPVGTDFVPFTGACDGAGHTISHLYINRPAAVGVGLFGAVDGATITNVTLTGVAVTAQGFAGTLIGGSVASTITNCHVAGNVVTTIAPAVGGLAATLMNGSILDGCSADCVVIGSSYAAGGLVGMIFAGNMLSECYASGTVSGSDGVGGFVAAMESGVITNCYSDATVSGTGNYVGGLIGLVEYMDDATIENCYSVGAVSGAGDVGGLVGSISGSAVVVSVAGDVDVFLGDDEKGNAGLTLSNNYWDSESSGQATSAGEGLGAIEGKITVAMMRQATFVGWDFGRIWSICEDASYPFLRKIPDPQPNIAVTIEQGSAQTDPGRGTIVFDVGFSALVTGFDNRDVDFSAGTAVVSAYTVTDSGDGMHYTVEVTAASGCGVVIATIPADAAMNPCSGRGNEASTSTDNSVYHPDTVMIYDVNDLQSMGADPGCDYVLANDIDASDTVNWNEGSGFMPVGDDSTSFSGTFDGAGHTITDLYINRPTTVGVGLFSVVSGATITDVTLAGVDVTAQGFAGALIAGAESSTITNCHVAGAVAVTTDSAAGGFAAMLMNGSTLSGCSADCVVTGPSNFMGGLVGALYAGNIAGCYASGIVSGENGIGGLVAAMSDGLITNCYSNATVSGTGYGIGGLIGVVQYTGDVVIENSYSVGAVSGVGGLGGLVGGVLDSGGTLTLTSTYWDTDSSGQTGSAIEGFGISERKTTGEMMAQATFVGWDFVNVWNICEDATYPFLRAIPNPYPQTPVEVTINQGSTQADPVNMLNIVFDVVFSAPVTGFEDGDVDFSAGTNVTGYTVTDSGDGMNYTLEVTSVLEDGSIIANVPAAVSVSVCSGADTAASTSTDNTVVYDLVPPAVEVTSVDPEVARDGVTVTVEVTASDYHGLNGVPLVTINGDAMTYQGGVGDVYTYTLTLGVGSTEGPATIVASVDDLAGNNGSETDTTWLTIDNTPPGIVISVPSQEEVSSGGSVDFTVDYMGASSCSLTESDITLDVTGDVTATVAVLEVVSCSYTVTLYNFAGTGTAGFGIAADTAVDGAGNAALSAYTPTLVTVTGADITPPEISNCPDDIEVEATPDNVIPDVTGDVVATDDITDTKDLLITQDPPAGTAVGLGVTMITVTVADEAGNTNSCTVRFAISMYHPADIDKDNQITMNEAISYVYGWQLGTNDIDFAIRVAFLWQNGEFYRYEPAITSCPNCWVND